MQDKQKEYWNKILYEQLDKPRLLKRSKQARRAKKQAEYRKQLIAGLNANASVNKPFVPKVIRRSAKLAQASEQASTTTSKHD
jgi:hypothetical protein